MESLDFWSKRFEHYDDATRSLFDKTVQLVTVGVTILVAGSAALFVYGKFAVLLTIPVIVVLLWTVAVRLIQEQMMTAAYRDYSEERAVELVAPGEDDPFLVWHSYGGVLTYGWINNLVFSFLIVVSCALTGGSLWAVSTLAPEVPFVLWFCVCAFAFLGAIGVGVILVAHRRHAAQAWKKIGERFSPPAQP